MSSIGTKLLVSGVVQSVGFRPYVKNMADKLGLKGYVRNMGSTGVEIILNSSENDVKSFITALTSNLPELAIVNKIEVEEFSEDQYPDFSIQKSSRDSKGMIALPPDISICEACIGDMSDAGFRNNYPFVSCTACGPRYATITELPYDRERTGFSSFNLCNTCTEEYESTGNRRFHAQTTVCSKCGPHFTQYLWTENKWLQIPLNWKEITTRLTHNGIIAMMSQSGTHLICNASSDQVIQKLRKSRRPSEKPFAIMVKDMEVARNLAHINPLEEKLLVSQRKPIVILRSKNILPNNIAPGLNTLGIMLPYSSMHQRLFSEGDFDSLVMTSANLPQLPMPITPEGVKDSLGGIADIALVHNLPIIQRVDDSVVQSHLDHFHLIRRSRGYIPQPYFLAQEIASPIIALGAQENNTVAIGAASMIINSQHIGNVVSVENLEMQRSTVDHLLDLYQVDPDVVLVDMHPEFLQRETAKGLNKKYNTSTTEVQHHVAHAASLYVDHGLKDEDLLVWSCDGYGYGNDGQAWGGELLEIGIDTKKHASFQPIPYPGGDINAEYPDRLLYLLSNGRGELLSDWNLKHGRREMEYLDQLLIKNYDGLVTTSAGRFLDSMASMLDICHYRSYRGEPAIKLGDVANLNTEKVRSEVFIDGSGNIDVKGLYLRTSEFLHNNSLQKTAAYLLQSLGSSMGELARTHAERTGIDNIGLSGGVAYNHQICHTFRDYINKSDLNPILHESVPCGDAGISTGQIYYYSRFLQ